MKRGSRHLGKTTGQHSRPQFHLSLLGSLASYGHGGSWRRKWERLKVTGGQTYKPIGCGASGAYAPGPDDEETSEINGLNFKPRIPDVFPFHPMDRQPPGGLGFSIGEVSRSHPDSPHSVGLLWTSDQHEAETST